MKKVKKAIIELIEPYMEKDLSDGCYIIAESEAAGIETENGTSFDDIFVFGQLITDETYKSFGWVYCLDVCTDWEKNEHDLSLVNFKKEEEREDDTPEIKKILGHYDISAVLKYITENKGGFTSDGLGLIIIDEYIAERSSWNNIGEIPNKPLHLYTEQEEKDLLDLLTKLGTLK